MGPWILIDLVCATIKVMADETPRKHIFMFCTKLRCGKQGCVCRDNWAVRMQCYWHDQSGADRR